MVAIINFMLVFWILNIMGGIMGNIFCDLFFGLEFGIFAKEEANTFYIPKNIFMDI